MARSMVSLGTLAPRALSIAVRRRGLLVGSPPPLAETVISLISLVHPFDFFESARAFLCLMVDHRLWPDIQFTSAEESFSTSAIADVGYSRRAASSDSSVQQARIATLGLS